MRGRTLAAGLVFVLAGTLAERCSSQANGPKQTNPVETVKNTTAAAGIEPENAAGSAACSGCHAEIYKSYSKTVMATASGPAADGVFTGEFSHKPSGVHYRVYQRDNQIWMGYDRPGKDGLHQDELRGQRELSYFIGSGRKGRSYLFSEAGFLFETPINWYSQEGRWNMTPAYTEARESPMNLPAYVDCLNCHTTGLQPPIAGTDNKFSSKPFLHGGITCQRCHGAGVGHIANQGTTGNSASLNSPVASSPIVDSAIVNPVKLSPERRDSVCMECHFEGTVAVEQPGKRLYQFQPGERLSDYIHYFLRAENQGEKTQALSQFEALSLSMCQRKSGDKMWCGSCHDPHREPDEAEKAAYYRGKCLNCHGESFGAKHHPDKPDCTSCHMPALPSKDVAHTESTDHRILRNPSGLLLESPQPQDARPSPRIVSFPARDAAQANTRDFALAWETLAERSIPGASREAEQYLRTAVKERPEDAVLLAALAFVEQEHGREKEARELYERALKVDPLANDAATNLGAIEARAGNLRRAVELWQGAFERVPYRSAIGMNLAMAFCAAGQKEEARHYVERVLEFNPDFGKARQLMTHLNGDPVQCKP
jgi:Tfp pilus assembly protein PilF